MGQGQPMNWRGTLEERLAARTEYDSNGCWVWKGAVQGSGYGVIWLNGHQVATHRISYELAHGIELPRGSSVLQLDHLCKVRRCLNPEHLELVTPRENTMRGNTITAANAAKTQCPRGHEYDSENTYLSNGKRSCRACARDRAHARYWSVKS